MNYKLGVDVSRWQGEMNWNVAKNNGVSFAMIKLSEGDLVFDPTAIRNATECKRLGIKFGFYHFWRPSVRTDKQLNWIRNLLSKPELADIKLDLGFALDCEVTEGYRSTELTQNLSALSLNLKKFLGYYPTIYTNQSFWINIGAWSEWKNHPLWVANWTTLAEPYMPKDWTEWKIWQYKVHSPGSDFGAQSTGIDLNRMVDDSPIEPPVPVPTENKLTATVKVEVNGVTYKGVVELEKL